MFQVKMSDSFLMDISVAFLLVVNFIHLFPINNFFAMRFFSFCLIISGKIRCKADAVWPIAHNARTRIF